MEGFAMGIIGFLAVPLGYVMRAIYGAVQNYGVAIQQKSTAKMSVFSPMIQDIQKKYAKDQERAQEEMMKLQEEYGFSPTAGCAPMGLNLLIMFGVIELVYRPLQYVLMIGSDALSEAVALLGMAARDYRGQVLLIQTIKGMSVDAAAAQFTSLTTDQITAIQGFQMNFLGIDLCATPQMALNALLILSLLSMLLMNYITMKMSGQEMTGTMKYMPWMMSLMFVWISFTLPVGFSLYYTVSNLLGVLSSGHGLDDLETVHAFCQLLDRYKVRTESCG